jgi:hypothetical protein
MFLRALATIVAADAFDRHMRDQQYRRWVAAEEARAAAANDEHRPLFAPPVEPPGFDPRHPERPT